MPAQSIFVTEIAMSRTPHQLTKRIATDMHKMFMVPRCKIVVPQLTQLVVNQSFHTVEKSERRQGAGNTVFKNMLELAFQGQAQGPPQLVLKRVQSKMTAGRNDDQQAFMTIRQDDTFGKMISRDMSKIRGLTTGLRKGVRNHIV